MRILALDSAQARAGVGVFADGQLLGQHLGEGALGEATRLPGVARRLLARLAIEPLSLTMIAVTVGPGSFTGIRAALAFAHGLALGAGIPVIGVTVGEALAQALPELGQRVLWAATDNRRDRMFLEQAPGRPEGRIAAYALDALPTPAGPVAIAGDKATAVAAWLAARGHDVLLTRPYAPLLSHVAAAALARHRGLLPMRPAMPLYVDPPEAKLPKAGLRPPPQ